MNVYIHFTTRETLNVHAENVYNSKDHQYGKVRPYKCLGQSVYAQCLKKHPEMGGSPLPTISNVDSGQCFDRWQYDLTWAYTEIT